MAVIGIQIMNGKNSAIYGGVLQFPPVYGLVTHGGLAPKTF